MKYPTDSQITLVDPSSPDLPGENIVLVFSRDDMLSAALHIRGDHLPSYVVKTLNGTTTVYAGNHLLATVTRRTFRRDQIIFPGSRPMRLANWLKAPSLSTFPLVFQAWDREFEWRESTDGQLVLIEAGYSDDIVAWFARSHPWFEDPEMRAVSLTIKPEVGEMRDMIVLSCLLAEHKRRIISAEHAKAAAGAYVMMAW